MNLIESERLVRKITDLLQNRPSEAQGRALAQAYAELCQATNHRLRQCAAMLAQGDEHQALQLAEAPPPVLELASRLAFRENEEWRQFCYKHELPVPDALEANAIRQLNAAYGKGISADHALYRDYRQAVLLHRDELAVIALRSISWRNPADTNAPRELERLERKILREKLDQLEAALSKNGGDEAVKWVEEIESLDFQSRPGGQIWRQGQQARCRLLVTQARACRAEGHWVQAAAHLTQLRALAAEHQLNLPQDTAAEMSALESWVAQCHKQDLEQRRFEQGLNELRQMLSQNEEQQVSGNLPNRFELRERLEALRHKWREVQLADLPINQELHVQVNKLLRLFEVRLARLEARKRVFVFAAAITFVLAATLLSVFYWGRRHARDVASELNSLRESRQVKALEERLAPLLARSSRLSEASPLKSAILSAEEFLRQEQQGEAECKVKVQQLETVANRGFADLAPEQVQARFDEAQRNIDAMAKDYQPALRTRFLSLRTAWESWLDTKRKARSSEFVNLLHQANDVATRELRFDRGPENIRVSMAALRPQLEILQTLASPPVARLAPPDDLQSQFLALNQRSQVFVAELAKWDKVQETWSTPTTIEAYLESLKSLQRSEFADPVQARAAAEVLALDLSGPALISALVLPPSKESFPQAESSPELRLQPEDVMPGERSRFRDLRDDENVHNIRVYRKTLRHALDSDPNRVRTIYLKGQWDNTRSTLRRGLIYDPKESPNELAFRRQEFYSEVEFEELGRTPEEEVFEAVGIRQFLESSATNYGGSVLGLLDRINRDTRSSPLFRGWLLLRFCELMDLRPSDWGAQWTPALARDRQRLKSLGADGLRSGDWLVPARQQALTSSLEESFAEARQVSYTEQARFLFELARRVRETGFTLVGHVNGASKAVVPGPLAEGGELWGWSAETRSPALLFHWYKSDPNPIPQARALPFSPLLVFRGDQRQLALTVRQSFGNLASRTGSWLPPLFAAHE